jgi:hypothetical protein
VLLGDAPLLRDVDLGAPLLPLRLEGRAIDRHGIPASATLAIAVNGTIRAVTRTLDVLQPGTWSAQLEPGALRAGQNDVRVFLVSESGARLQLAYPAGLRPPAVNLAAESAVRYWSVRQTGLLPQQPAHVPFRWTGPVASITAPLHHAQRPRSVRIGIAGPPPSAGRVQVAVNECSVYEGPVDSAPWYRTFSLDGCSGIWPAAEARIVIRTGARSRDGQQGVAIETVNLFPATWPPPPARPASLRAAVHVAHGAAETVARGEPLVLDVYNRGSAAWVDAPDPEGRGGAVLELRWQRIPAGARDHSQRLRLPRVLYPDDAVRVEVPVVPPASVDGQGPWELTIVPVTGGGTEIHLDEPCTVRVRAATAVSG